VTAGGLRACDVLAAADSLERQLRPTVDADWSQQAWHLTWAVWEVVDHLADVCGYYAIHLGAGSPDRLLVDVRPYLHASNDQRLDVVIATSRLLAAIIDSADHDTKGWHFDRPTDAEGFAGLACNELLVHGWDITESLDLSWEADETLCARVLDSTFPAVRTRNGSWPTLLSANGRNSRRM
jgi:hypothetical protein